MFRKKKKKILIYFGIIVFTFVMELNYSIKNLLLRIRLDVISNQTMYTNMSLNI